MAEDATGSEEEADEVATDEVEDEVATGEAEEVVSEKAVDGPAPVLRITGLHIAGYRSLRRLDWPADGLGWGGKIPDIVLVGGANGSGKTTLLELIYRVFEGLRTSVTRKYVAARAQELVLDLEVAGESVEGTFALRYAVGSREFLLAQRTEHFRGQLPGSKEALLQTGLWESLEDLAQDEKTYANTDFPQVAYFPSGRPLSFPEDDRLKQMRPQRSTLCYRYTPAQNYEDSITALFYDARWHDLNAKEEGRPEEATNFAEYADAFRRFIGDDKQLVWDHGELYVKTPEGARHELPALSSGEKQVLLFAVELQRQWYPGSLILIDEPELHLHEAWQTTLFELIRDLQRERGGQVIMATQSNHLFGLGDDASAVVLRKGWP